ncbi:hypothetical protein ACC739_37775, partial [Rhizobium ruizarguesonis]
MRTYKSAGFRHLSQKRIEDLSCLSVVERVHPDKHGVDCKELFETWGSDRPTRIRPKNRVLEPAPTEDAPR